jgi:periplasmic protein TorT
MKNVFCAFLFIITTAVLFVLCPLSVNAEQIHVNSYYGDYDVAMKKLGFPSASLSDPISEIWETPTPKKPYHIGVLFPHHKDSYWITANYGIISHAKKLGIKITLYEAGSYINFGNQRQQLDYLSKNKKIDGIILASVDYTKMDTFVERAVDRGVPVIELINDIFAPKIQAKSMVSFYEMGYQAGEFVINDSYGKDIKIAFFPGPEASGWAPDTYAGFKEAMNKLKKHGQQITLLKPVYGDTRPKVQRMRIDYILNKPQNYQIDYIVGNAVACVEAVKYLRKNKINHSKAKIVSTYITKGVYEQIKEKNIAAAPSDQTIHQCIIALDMMTKILNGEQPGKHFPFRVSPIIPVISKNNIQKYPYENILGKKDYIPVVHRLGD